jgi:hypothetical protein
MEHTARKLHIIVAKLEVPDKQQMHSQWPGRWEQHSIMNAANPRHGASKAVQNAVMYVALSRSLPACKIYHLQKETPSVHGPHILSYSAYSAPVAGK